MHRSAALTLAILLSALPSGGQLLTFRAAGLVDLVPAAAEGVFNEGDGFEMIFTFDPWGERRKSDT